MRKTLILISTGFLMLTGCDSLYPPTPKPDNTIKVTQTSKGAVATPPTCLPWSSATTDPYDNQPFPQFGCANARNLALMVDQPSDLVHGRDMGPASGVMAVGAMRRYYSNQTRGLVDTDTSADTSVAITTAPTAASPLTGDVTGGGSSSSSSSSAAPAAGP
jgi:type IV pilus biogenesis protein CpaD/CtpE